MSILKSYIRNTAGHSITGENRIVLTNRKPYRSELHDKFSHIDELGLYLHIPFCRYICPYCPYNKELYKPDLADRYADALIREIDYYSGIVGGRPVTSFYIGGGTPTSMLNNGMDRVLEHIYAKLNMQCGIHMESHPNDLSQDNLDKLKSLGVKYLSIGVEALQERHLNSLKRPYTVSEVCRAVSRATAMGFECVNVDYIFAIPGQTMKEVEQAGRELIRMDVQQAATYPLFLFPYTRLGNKKVGKPGISTLVRRRKMLAILEEQFYSAGYERSSVWAFTKKGVEKYCSVTVPLYLGLGASGGTYLKDIFFLNTFSVREYIKSIEQGEMPVALSIGLTEKMQMAGWLYWRIYETRILKKEFYKRFLREFDSVYGKLMNKLARIGFIVDSGNEVMLTDRGSYWLHAFEDLFSIDFIGKLWGNSSREPWPSEVILMQN